MKKRYKGLLILGAIVFGIPLILWLSWLFTPPKPLSIFIMDKSSYTNEMINKRAINWLLRHYRFVKPNGKDYDPKLDYFGFFPSGDSDYVTMDLSEMSSSEIQQLALQHDVAYFADNYGVFSNMWPINDPDTAAVIKLYGGLDDQDIQFIDYMLRLKKLVVAEFIFLAPPTAKDVRRKAEELLGIEWQGWTGRYFQTLDVNHPDEILPGWIPVLFEKQYRRPWNFKEPGIVLVNEDEKLVILEKGYHLGNNAVPVVKMQPEDRKHFGVTDGIGYPGWFDITLPGNSSAKVLSWFELDLTDQGKEILIKNNIPLNFPSIIQDTGVNNFYYFAGDFGQSPVSRRFVRFKGARFAELFLTDLDDPTDKKGFFLTFYLPLTRKILLDYYQDKGSE